MERSARMEHPLGADAATPGERVRAVARRIESYRDRYEAARDPRAIFAHAYATITHAFAHSLDGGTFRDPDWLARLDEVFGELYFRAVDAWDEGRHRDVPDAWLFVFRTLERRRTSTLEELLLGMAAHIVRDLPVALREVGLEDAAGRPRVEDFHRTADVLEGGIGGIQNEVGRRYNPWLRWLDHLGGDYDEFLTDYGFRLSRAAAWYNAVRLSEPSLHARTLASVEASVRIMAERVVRPPFLSARILLRLGRVLSTLGRRWPARSRAG